jgi:hypothetical protein
MSKDKCRVNGCRYQLWNKGYCRVHQFFLNEKEKKGEERHISVLVPREDVSVKSLIVILDKEFSIYMRRKNGDIIKCCTCSAVSKWNSFDYGHYIPRGNESTRFLETNGAPQCVPCNRFNDGMSKKMREYLVRIHGEKVVIDLENKGREVKNWSRSELLDMIKFYRELNKKFDA